MEANKEEIEIRRRRKRVNEDQDRCLEEQISSFQGLVVEYKRPRLCLLRESMVLSSPRSSRNKVVYPYPHAHAIDCGSTMCMYV